MYKKIKYKSADYLEVRSPKTLDFVVRHKVIIKYSISGVLAAIVNLGLLYILTEEFGFLYLFSSVLAFAFGMSIAFFLQKYWTFRDNKFRNIGRQFLMYGSLAAITFIFSPIMLAFLVEVWDIWYILAQIIIMLIFAVVSFTINKSITFKEKKE